MLPLSHRILACGSVDDGKSTMVGRLLFECGAVPDDMVETLERDSRRWGTVEDGFDYALLVDGLAAEREQGITIDVAYRYFATPKHRFILADCPGHEQYTRNMVNAASTADLAVLLVDARKGVLAQTRRHAALSSLLGIQTVVLAVNKMDLVEFGQAVFNEIVAAFSSFSTRLFASPPIGIPIVARDGDNMTKRSARMEWYRGPSLLSALESSRPNDILVDRPFRMHVQWVNRSARDFRGFAGTVGSGVARPGMAVTNVSSGTRANIARIVTMDRDLEEARSGDAVTIVLDAEIDGSRGDVLASSTDAPDIADRITAQVIWMDEAPLVCGRSYLFMQGTRSVAGTIIDIISRHDIETLADVPASELQINEIGRVRISFSQPVAFEPYSLNRELGGFIVIDHITNATVGAGLIQNGEAKANNVYWYKLDIDKRARSDMKQQKPAVLWFTGLSGAGKSTIANLVEKRLHALGRHTMLLDGDNMRHGLNRDLGFSETDRVENVRRLAEVSRLFVDAGVIVLVSCISPDRAERRIARERVDKGEFLEIYIDTPIGECRKRDKKGLYARADAGQINNFTGVDAPYEKPDNPDIHIDTMNGQPEALADRIVSHLREYRVIV